MIMTIFNAFSKQSYLYTESHDNFYGGGGCLVILYYLEEKNLKT